MGEPVKIIDLARDMIRLSGLEPERDIAIEVIGPRPGREAPRGALQPATSAPQPTPAQKILRAEHPRLDPAWEQETFDQVELLVLDGDAAALAAKVGELATVARRCRRRLGRRRPPGATTSSGRDGA